MIYPYYPTETGVCYITNYCWYRIAGGGFPLYFYKRDYIIMLTMKYYFDNSDLCGLSTCPLCASCILFCVLASVLTHGFIH